MPASTSVPISTNCCTFRSRNSRVKCDTGLNNRVFPAEQLQNILREVLQEPHKEVLQKHQEVLQRLDQLEERLSRVSEEPKQERLSRVSEEPKQETHVATECQVLVADGAGHEVGELQRQETQLVTKRRVRFEEDRAPDDVMQLHSSMPFSEEEGERPIRGRSRFETRDWMGKDYEEDAFTEEREEPWERQFDVLAQVLIVMNTIFIGVEVHFRMDAALRGQAPPSWLMVGMAVFTAATVIEVLLKASLLGRAGQLFRKKDRLWNCIDVFVAVCMVIELISELVSTTLVLHVRILRALRVVRIWRAIRYFYHLRFMIASIATSFKTLCWAFVLLVIVLFMCAVIIDLGVEASLRDGISDEVRPALEEQYGGLMPTMTTLFMAISGGRDWGDCMSVLRDVGVLYQLLFVVYVGFASFCVVGVLTAVIIDASGSILAVDKELAIERVLRNDNERRQHLADWFRHVQSEDGTIDKKQFQAALSVEKHGAFFKTLELDVSHWKHAFKDLDADSSGTVNIKEFVNGFMRCRGIISTIRDENRRVMKMLAKLEKLLQDTGIAP